jgi:ubiquinone/menaquinone biosynthesis C-methylase UbiE
MWADMGSGTGAFTLALAELLGPTGQIRSVDKDHSALQQQKKVMANRFPATIVTYHIADYTQPLDLPLLDGMILANTLHFLPKARCAAVLQLMRSYLRPGGRLILVEYDTDRGNRWVPYPMSFPTWQIVTEQAGFTNTTRLVTRPSRFLGQIYAALSFK